MSGLPSGCTFLVRLGRILGLLRLIWSRLIWCLSQFSSPFGLWFLVSVIGMLEAVAPGEIQNPKKKVLFKVATLPFL